MLTTFQRLPETHQGIIYLSTGLILILYALGFIQKGLTIIFILFAIYLVFVGFVKMGWYKKTVESLHHKK